MPWSACRGAGEIAAGEGAPAEGATRLEGGEDRARAALARRGGGEISGGSRGACGVVISGEGGEGGAVARGGRPRYTLKE